MHYTPPPGYSLLIGSDEAGYGALAGNLIIVAVMALPHWSGPPMLNDSKQLTDKKTGNRRLHNLAGYLRGNVAFSMVEYTPVQIDQKGVGACLKEGHQVVHSRLRAQAPLGDVLWNVADGNLVFPAETGITSIVKADATIPHVAAASVLAKSFQLMQMQEHDKQWPFYGFWDHAGYPSPRHLAELDRSGPTPIHRRSYGPVKDAAKELGHAEVDDFAWIFCGAVENASREVGRAAGTSTGASSTVELLRTELAKIQASENGDT